jgi:hypothetical protein
MLTIRVRELEQRADVLIADAKAASEALRIESDRHLKEELATLEEEFARRLETFRAEAEAAHTAALQSLSEERIVALKRVEQLGEGLLDELSRAVAQSLSTGGSHGD